jgi:hypothetical protein
LPAVEPSTTIAPGELGELAANGLDNRHRRIDRDALLLLELEVRATQAGEVAVARRVVGVEECVAGLVVAHERRHALVSHEVGTIDGVRRDEAVEAAHDGEQHVGVLGDPNRHDGVVVRLLPRLCEQHQPARVARAHRVTVVAVDVDGRGKRAVRVRHHDG